ncbi:MAG: peptidoglycan DD-metalloendopeptidase family protein [Sporichthyaceae bacterium]
MAALLLPSAAADDELSDRKRAAEASIEALDADLDESSAKVAAATRALSAAEAKLAPARAALGQARADVVFAEAAQGQAAKRLAKTVAEAERTRLAYEATLAEIATGQAAVGAMARAMYMNGGMSRLSIAMEAQSPSEFTSALAYWRAVNRSEEATLRKLDDKQRELALTQARLEALRLRTVEEQAVAAAAVATTTAARESAATAAVEVERLVQVRQGVLDEAEKLKAGIEKRLREQQAEADRLARLIKERAAAARRAAQRAAERAGRTLDVTGGVLSYPVNGPITSNYGMRYHPILRYYKLHTGTDFGVPTGTSVRSAMGGTVLESYYNSAYGNRVVVEHGFVRGVYLVTTYNHLTRSTVRPGEKLDRGEVLGYAGSTGYSTGPHLHFETIEDGEFVNPMTWLG